MSWLLPAKRSASVSFPLGPSKTYSFSTFSHGSARRLQLSTSRSRVKAFSSARNFRRASTHLSCETMRWALTASPRIRARAWRAWSRRAAARRRSDGLACRPRVGRAFRPRTMARACRLRWGRPRRARWGGGAGPRGARWLSLWWGRRRSFLAPFAWGLGRFFLRGRHGILRAQRRLEGVEPLAPEDAVAFHPFHGALHRCGIESEEVLASRHAAAHQLGALEDADVLGDGIERDIERRRKLRHAGLTPGEVLQDGPAGGIREGDQGVVEGHGSNT